MRYGQHPHNEHPSWLKTEAARDGWREDIAFMAKRELDADLRRKVMDRAVKAGVTRRLRPVSRVLVVQ